MGFPAYEGQLSEAGIAREVLSMVPRTLMEQRYLMPAAFDPGRGRLTLATSRPFEVWTDLSVIHSQIAKDHPEVKAVTLLACEYENLAAGYMAAYGHPFSPAAGPEQAEVEIGKATNEQTRLADEILQRGIENRASDIHITPGRDGPSRVEFRVDGKLHDSGIVLSREDSVILCNIYKRNASLEVTNLVGQDGRFSFMGRDFRLSTQPYGGDNLRNKVVLRIMGGAESSRSLDQLGFSSEEVAQLRRLIHKPSGIILICGPTGEGKSTTLYACLQELAQPANQVIVTVEDPIEKYIPGVAQCQVRLADNERASLTFSKALRSMMRQDPDVIMVGEIRDGETALVAVQASQTGHLILSTLHVRNSISAFRRLSDMGANVSGFAEQIVGISSQRLLSLNCPHCRKSMVSPRNSELREQDLALLKEGEGHDGRYGRLSYFSSGCERCGNTGFIGRLPLIEIIPFDNYLRDFFAQPHGLVDIERHLRSAIGFTSLWDKGMRLVADGRVSLEELLSVIEPDADLAAEGREAAHGVA